MVGVLKNLPDPRAPVVTPCRREVMLLPYLTGNAGYVAPTECQRKTRPSNSQMGTAQV